MANFILSWEKSRRLLDCYWRPRNTDENVYRDDTERRKRWQSFTELQDGEDEIV